jgi:hypothetical protein
VRSTGTLDAVFMNYGTEVSQLLYFTLAAGSANWNDYFIANYT